MSTVKVKGFNLLSSRNAIETLYGKEAVQKVIASLPPEDQAIFLNPILSHAYYPLDAYVRWLEGEIRVLYKGKREILERQFQDATEKAVHGIYSMIQRFASPREASHAIVSFNMLQ